MATAEEKKRAAARARLNRLNEYSLGISRAREIGDENKLADIGAILTQLEAEGADEAALKRVADEMYTTGEFSTELPALDFSNVQGGVILPAAKEEKDWTQKRLWDIIFGDGFTDAAIDTAQAGAQNTARAALVRAGESDNPLIRGLTTGAVAASDLASGDIASMIKAAAGSEPVIPRAIDELGAAAKANTAAAAPAREALGSRNWLIRNLGEGGLDALSSPSSAASIVGGPLGAVSVIDAYDQAYAQAVDAGIDSDEDREMWALSQAAPELVSFLPASKVLQKLPVIGKAIDHMVKKPVKNIAASIINREGSPAIKALARTLNTSIGEGLEEGFTGGLQDIAAGITGVAGEGKLGELGRSNASTTLGGNEGNGTFTDTLWESFRAGAIMGGGLAAPGNVAKSYQERADFIEETSRQTEADILAGADRARSNAIVLPDEAPVAVNAAQSANYNAQDVAAREATNPNIDRELFNVEQDIAADAAKRKALDDAFNQREEEQALQQAVEEEAGFRTIANQQNSQGTMADALRGAGVTTEVTPAQVAAEVVQADKAQKAEAKREADRKAAEEAASARVRVINDVNRLRPSVEKEVATAENKKQAAQASQRSATIKQLIRDNPKATDAEIADMLPAALAKKQEAKAAPAPAKAPAKKAAPAKPQAKTAPDIAKLKESADPLDRAQAEALERLGMSGTKAAVTPADFGDKVKRIARGLATDTSARAGAAERLIKQGKLVIVPNADHTGGERTKRPGEYDPETGTTYIYTDNIEGDNIAEIMEAASHESGHLGQFNERDQRPEKMKALLGRGITDASKVLRKAARNGNKFAQEALRRAEEDTEQRRKDGQENPGRYENEELVAYAIGQENAGRTSILGSAGGAVRDVVAGAKEQLRKRLGVNLKITANDVRSAMANMLQEATETDTKSSKGDRLGMIYNKNSKGFDEAVANGWVYDSVDGDKKYVLSDADSKIKPGAAQKLAKATSPIRLADILEHPVLFKEHPEAANIPVIAVDSLGKGVFGTYDSSDQSIYVTRELAERTDPYKTSLREALMHEIQHFVQDVGGYAKRFYSGKDRDPTVVKARAELKKAERSNDLAAATLLTNATRLTPNRDDKMAVATVVRGEGSDHRKATQLVDLFKDMEVSPELQAFIDDFNITKQNYNEKATAANVAAELAFANYQANITEREAFRTQYDVDAPESEIRARGNPEAMMRTQEEMDGVDPTGGRIDVPTVEGTVEARAERLGMAGRPQDGAKAAIRNRNKATTFLMSAIRNDKGLGAHIRDEVELAKAAPVEFESKANKAAGQYDAAIKRMAAEKGTTPEKLNAEIRDKLEAIAEMEGTASEYKAEFDKIADQYGRAGAALKRLRQAVDDLSVELLKTYLDSGVKLTNKEKNDLKKVANNLGRYVHRFYASRLGRGLGEQYSRAVQDAVDKVRAKGKGSLTPKEQELNDRYVNAAKTVLDGVMIPSEEDIGSLLESQVDYLYDTWFGTDTTGMTREDKESALLERREEIGADELQEKTDAALQALLWSAKESAATRYYDRGEKLDTTIMQERSRIPKEIRALMGEVTDPAAALVNTVSKQAEYVARTKLMFALRNMASPQDLQPPGSAGNAAVRNNNMVELKGEAYGPLNGYFASPSLRAMIDDTAESLQNFTEAMTTGAQQYEGAVSAAARGAAKAWMKGASGAKAVNIVGNAFLYPLNFLGSFGMLGLNGNINVKSWGRGFTDAVDIIRYAAKPSAGLGGAELASKYRVVDSATVGDLKQLDLGKIEQVVREMSGKSPGAFMRKARELGMAGRELYAMMDVWSKIANFHAEVDFLKSMYKAEGIDKSDDAIYREAAAIVNNTNMSYARTAPFIKAIERAGITQYGPYMYEAHRVVLTNIMQGLHELYRVKDMKTTKGKALMAARGTARLAGTAGVLSMIGTLSHFAAGMWGDDEEDKRALLPEYARIMDFLNVGKDEDGNPILYGVSNVDPLGPITDLYRAARIGADPAEAVWNQFKENYVSPALGGALWDVVARTTGFVPPTSSRPRKPLVAQWSPNGWSKAMSVTGNEDAWASIAHFVETRYMPGTPRAWSESNPIAAGGSMNEVAYNIARGMGARGLRYSPQVGTVDAAFTYDDTMKTLRRDLAAYVENTTNPSEEEVLGRLLEMRIEEKRAWDQLARVRRGMLAVGMSEEEADAELKLARVPKEVIEQLAEEDYQSRVISETSISSAAKTQIRKAKTQKQKDEVAAKWQAAWEILGEFE